MSRALEKHVIESIKSGDTAFIYKEISELLDFNPDDGLIEIELLGSSYPLEPGVNYLRDGNAVAIPKLRLVQAFFVARKILQSQQSLLGTTSLDEAAVRQATGVTLLMDPEHLTAANMRKRALLCFQGDRESASLGSHDCEIIVRVLERETVFLDSLLTSHLHRHTKSPTLWSHRRWLVKMRQSCGIVSDVLGDIRRVVTVAAGRHPRNYYAWSHSRWLVETLLPPAGHMSSDHTRMGEDVVNLIKDWCFRNHSDTSGWSFLYFAGNLLQPHETVLTNIFAETLRLASSFRWTNESVWVFLRTVAASGMVRDVEVANFVDVITALKSSASEDGKRILDAALRWADEYGSRAPS